MKLYIKATSSYRSDEEDLDLKKILKQKYKLDVRRKDNFMYLAIFGASRLQENIDISADDELYLSSASGNIDIITKTDDYVYETNQYITPIDFINILSNTTSYYVATALGLRGKNLFQCSNEFTVINSLISIYASIFKSKNDAIFGALDRVSSPTEISSRLLGVDEDCELVSSVNYQKLSLSSEDAIGEIEFDVSSYTLEEVKKMIEIEPENVYASMRCQNIDAKKSDKFFHTELSYHINNSLKNKTNMLYIDCFNDKYKILRLNIID